MQNNECENSVIFLHILVNDFQSIVHMVCFQLISFDFNLKSAILFQYGHSQKEIIHFSCDAATFEVKC